MFSLWYVLHSQDLDIFRERVKQCRHGPSEIFGHGVIDWSLVITRYELLSRDTCTIIDIALNVLQGCIANINTSEMISNPLII